MVTAYSPILKLALPVQGELSGTWGDVVNDNITSMVEQAIAGRAVIDTWTTDSHTLTTANGTTSESRCAMLELTDTGTALTGAGTVICPTASKIYIVKNDAGQNITVKTVSGTGILVPDGRTTFLFCDGTNVVEAMTHTTSLQLGTSTVVTAVLDEDNMASDSATSLATQQSIKAYVDAQVGANNELSEVLANGNTSGANDIIIDNGQKITVDTIDETTADSGVTIDSVLLKDDGVNATNLEVTNIKANDGTVAGSIADSTGVVTVASAVLTTADINGGTADDVVIGGTTPAAATVTTVTANTSLNIAGTVTVTSILDEDNMASDDPAGLATQQSIKAYVDAQVGANNELSEVLANGNTTGGTDIAVSAGDDITFTNTSKAIFGTGSSLEIYGDGSNSYIKENGTGQLVVNATNLYLRNSDNTQDYLTAVESGATKLLYADAIKLATTSTGIDVTGDVGGDSATISGDLTVDTDTLYVDSTNDRVGVNNTGAAGYDLYVGNGLTGTKAFALNGQGSGSSVMNIDFLGGGTGNPTGRISFGSSAEALSFSTGDNASITTAMTIDSSQRVLINGTASTQIRTRQAVLQSNGTSSDAGASFTRWTNGGGGPYLTFAHSRSATVNGGFTILQADDILGSIDFAGADGTDLTTPGASIDAVVDGTPGANDMPGRLQFYTTADGASSATERMRIQNDGNVGIGFTSPSTRLFVSGGVNSAHTTFSGQLSRGLVISTVNTLNNDDGVVYNAQTVSGKHIFQTAGTEAMRINSSGYAIISSTGNTRSMSLGSTTSRLTIEGTSSTAGRAGVAGVQNSNDTSGPVHYLAKSRGTVNNSNTIVQGGDYLGQLNWNGADGTQLIQAGNISMQVDGTPAVNDMPGRLVFMTTADGANYPTERMRIDNAGNVGIGTQNPQKRFVVSSGDNREMHFFESTDIMTMRATADSGSYTLRQMGLEGSEVIFKTQTTSNVSGVEAMRIDSSQRVLIGLTTSAAVASVTASDFQVETGGIGASIVSTAGAAGPAGVLALGHKRGAGGIVLDDDALGEIRFSGHDGSDLVSEAAKIRGSVDGTPGSNDMPGRLEFYTTSDGASSPTERMRIDSDGLATFYYSTKNTRSVYGGYTALTLENSSANAGVLNFVDLDMNAGTTGAAKIRMANPSASAQSDGQLIFQTTSSGTLSEAMRIDSSQRVLVGTNSSIQVEGYYRPKFQVAQAGNSDSAARGILINYGRNNTGGGAAVMYSRHSGTTVGSEGNVLDNYVLGENKFTGWYSDNYYLGALMQVVVDGSPSSADMPGRIVFSTTADGTASPTERMRITNAGRVIIQTGSSATGTYSATSAYVQLNNSASGAAGNLLTADNGNTWLNADGGQDLWLNWDSANNASSYADFNVGDGYRGTHILRVNGATRDAELNQSLLKFTTPGDGILFSGNSRTNALNDYERGNWNPTFGGTVTAPSVTYSIRRGSYTKIGNYVIAFWDMTATAMSGGSGQAIITGLPFSAAANSDSMAGYSVLQFRASTAMPSTANATDVLKGYIAGVVGYLEIDNSGSAGYGTRTNAPMWTTGRSTGYIIYTTN